MKIECPDWRWIMQRTAMESPPLFSEQLDRWFDDHVEPINKLLADRVEVYNFEEVWHPCKTAYGDERPVNKALLINIQPIKQETAEDVLRELLGQSLPHVFKTIQCEEFRARAKRVLGESDE